MIANYIAPAAVIAFLANMAWRRFGATSGGEQGRPAPGKIRSMVYSFLAGVLLANSIPHFIHGISGEYFPAPFFHTFGKGAATDIANVLWGLFCFGLGYRHVLSFRDMPSPVLFRALVCCGFVTMSIFLAVFFSSATYR